MYNVQLLKDIIKTIRVMNNRTSNMKRNFDIRNKKWFPLHKHEKSIQFAVNTMLLLMTLEEECIATLTKFNS